MKQEPSKPPTNEAPGSWRTSLRKAGSSVTLGTVGLADSSQDPSRAPDSGLGMTRSASSPRLSSEAETKVHSHDLKIHALMNAHSLLHKSNMNGQIKASFTVPICGFS